MPLTTNPRPANVRSSQWLVPAAGRDVTQLTSLSEEEIIALGGLAHAYYRGPNDTGFQTISMNAATTLAATHLRHLEPEKLAYLTSSTGLSDEDLYVFSKWAC